MSLVGFGTFTVAKRAARSGRNPRTGAAIKIKSAKVPKFRPARRCKRRAELTAARHARVLSSAGRAAPLQGVGRRFEPVSTHHPSGRRRPIVLG